jgi:hypothetical protein
MTVTATPPAAPATPPADPDTPPAPVAADPPPVTDPPTPSAGDPPPADPATPPAAPAEVTYDLKLPDKSGLHASIIKRTAATARELGLDNAAAQKVLDFVRQEASSHAEKSTAHAVEEALKAHQPGGEEWAKQEAAWKADALADPVLGKTPEERRAVIDKGKAVLKRFTDARPEHAEQFKDFLEETGLGSHKATLQFFGWLGQSMSEGKFVLGDPNAGQGRKTAAQLMYPDQAGKPGAVAAAG